jgi:hypothetical protein
MEPSLFMEKTTVCQDISVHFRMAMLNAGSLQGTIAGQNAIKLLINSI